MVFASLQANIGFSGSPPYYQREWLACKTVLQLQDSCYVYYLNETKTIAVHAVVVIWGYEIINALECFLKSKYMVINLSLRSATNF